jgi:delta 1-pyrroline-5-carboxylate dehydrogenase
MREGLTNISDDVFEFFLYLQKEITHIMTYKTLMEQSKHFFKYVLESLLAERKNLEMFITKCIISKQREVEGTCSYSQNESVEESVEYICESLTNVSTHCLKLFEKIVKLFVTVLLSQFRKDYLRIIQREKGKTLRKKVVESKEKKMIEGITFDFIKNDESKEKEIKSNGSSK